MNSPYYTSLIPVVVRRVRNRLLQSPKERNYYIQSPKERETRTQHTVMVSPHGIQLATNIISSFYGELCSKVCECLLRRGTLTLAQIIQSTQLTRENVINCLRVLIHQNCIQAFSTRRDGSYGEAPRILTQYMALSDNVIHKLRAPKFMQIVSEKLGKECFEIFQGLIQHGRLSFKQIIERKEETSAGKYDIHILRESFTKLLNARFIERCPAPEPFIEPPSEEEASTKKRVAKSGKIAGEPQSMEQVVLAAAAPMESRRFLMEIDDVPKKNDEESSNLVTLPQKRKQDVFKSDGDVLDPDRKKEVLWRVNFEELVRHMKNKACISYVKTRINDEAGIVLSAILELSERTKIRQKTAYLSINAIYDEVIKKEGGLGMDFERIRVSLGQLRCETLSAGLDESYSVDIKGIIEMAQNEEVEAVVLRKHGKEAYRVFKLLSKEGRLIETDKIAEATFVEKKDTLKILYRLWKDEYVHMEKVTSSGAARQLEFLVWSVNKETLWEQVLDEMYHAALNLRLRVAREQEKAKEVLQLPAEKLVGELAKRYNLVRKIRVLLESSLLNLDDAIMLFHDF